VLNPLDLNGAARTITVTDNTTTFADIYTLSGVISGRTGSSLTLNGGGSMIIINAADTYSGNTTVTGTVAVSSIGSGGSSSAFGDNTGQLNLGNGTTTGGYLLYTGSGETPTRTINIFATTATDTIDSSGSGALVINNLVNAAAGAKILVLRGSSSDANMMNAVLSDNGGALSIAKSDGGTWILTGANTFTGGIVAGASGGSGLIGIGSAWSNISASAPNPLGMNTTATGVILSNVGLFTLNPNGLTIGNGVALANNTTDSITGQYSITLNQFSLVAGANNWALENTLSSNATLIIGGAPIGWTGTATVNQTLTIQGTGNTMLNAALPAAPTSGAFGLTLGINTLGMVTLNAANSNTAGATLTEGTVMANANTPFGTAGTLTLNGALLEAGANLTGAIPNPVTIGNSFVTIGGTNSIQFSGLVGMAATRVLTNNLSTAGGVLLTLSGGITNTAVSTFTLTGSGNTLISGAYNAGTGANALTYAGTGTLTLMANNAYTGATNLNSGSTVISGAGQLSATSGVTVTAGATLTLDNTASNLTARLGGKPLTLSGGTLAFIGNSGGSTETDTTLALNSGASSINFTNNGSNNTDVLNFTTLTFGTGGTIDFGANIGVTVSGATNEIKFSAAPTLSPGSTGILAEATVNGSDFATYGTTNGITAFTGYTTVTNVNGAAATATLQMSSGSSTLTASETINALKLNGTGITVGGAAGTTLTLTSGGVLVTGGPGTDTLSVPFIQFAAASNTTEAAFQINAGSTLNLSSVITALQTGGLVKGLGGALNIATQQFYTGTTTLNGGTTKLTTPAGSVNTLVAAQGLAVNLGATLDLDGNTQYVGLLSSSGILPNTGGTITNSNLTTASTLVVSETASSTWAGNITGNLNFVRANGNTLTVESANSYTGATLLTGGTTTIQDGGALTNTASIDINGAILSVNEEAGLFLTNPDRINDAAPITLRGGTLTYTGRANTYSTETFGALTSAQGANVVTDSITALGTYQNADITFASLARTAGSTVNFTASAGTLGSEGSNPRILVTNTAGLYNTATGVIGAWAIANSDTFAAYNPSLGIGAVGTDGYQGYAAAYISGGSVTTINNVNITSGGTLNGFVPTNGSVVGNVTNLFDGIVGVNNAITLPSGGASTDYLRLAGAAEGDILFTGSNDVLNLNMGGLIHSNSAEGSSTIGSTAVRGVLTSGTPELVIYNTNTATTATGATTNSSVNGTNILTLTSTTNLFAGMALNNANFPLGTYVTAVLDGTHVTTNFNAIATGNAGTYTFASNIVVNSVIANNGMINNVALVKSGTGTLTLTAANTYTGGTTVDQGALFLDGAGSGAYVIPAGGLTISNATVTMAVNSGQIDPGNNVTLNGSSTLTLTGNNYLGSITFNNNGGTGTPTVTPTGVLTLTGSITSSSNTVATGATTDIATIGAGTLDLGGASNFLMTVNPVDPFNTGTANVAPLQAGLIINALIQDGGILKQGGGILLLANAGNSYTGATTITTGTVKLGAAGAVPVSSSLVVGPNGTFDLGGFSDSVGSLAGATPTTGGFVTNTGAAATLTIGADNTSQTFAGIITAATPSNLALTKVGSGTQTLTNSELYAGATTINGGAIALGNAVNLASSPVTVNNTGTLAIKATASGTSNTLSSLTLNGGSTLTMADGLTTTLNMGTLAITAPSVLVFDVNGGASPTSDSLVAGAVSNTAGTGQEVIDINYLGGTLTQGETFNLITAASGIGTSQFTLGTTKVTSGGVTYGLSLSGSGTNETLTVTGAIIGSFYWTGNGGATWGSTSAGSTNWATSISGTPDANAQPNSTTDVYFTANGVTSNLTNTLGADFTINSLNFTAGAGAVTIGGTNTLTIDGTVDGTSGITVAGGSTAQTINTSVTLGIAQTWTNNSTGLLSVGSSTGAVSNGALLLTIAGSGPTTITNFNGGAGGFTVSAGTGTTTLANATLSAAQTWTDNNTANPLNVTGALSTGSFLLTLAGSGNIAISATVTGSAGLEQNSTDDAFRLGQLLWRDHHQSGNASRRRPADL
jgi:autotransporter-associated beta strand protein